MAQQTGSTATATRWGRAGRFFAGYLLGLAGLPLVLGVAAFGFAVVRAQVAKPAETPTAVTTFVVSGGELSRLGATSLVWRRPDEVLLQTCRGPCDDLVFRYHPQPRLAEANVAVENNATPWLQVVKAPAP